MTKWLGTLQKLEMVGVGSGARSRYWRKIKSLCREYGNLDVQLPLDEPLKCGEYCLNAQERTWRQARCDATTGHSFETLVDVWDPGRIHTTPMVHIDGAKICRNSL